MFPVKETSPSIALINVDFPEPIGPAIMVIEEFSSLIVISERTASTSAAGETVVMSMKIAADKSTRGDNAVVSLGVRMSLKGRDESRLRCLESSRDGPRRKVSMRSKEAIADEYLRLSVMRTKE